MGKTIKIVLLCLTAVIACFASLIAWIIITPSLPEEAFSIAALDARIARQQTVLVNFSSERLLACKTNEKTIFDSSDVQNKIKASNVCVMRADCTNENPEAAALLKKFGRTREGIPFYVIFLANNLQNLWSFLRYSAKNLS